MQIKYGAFVIREIEKKDDAEVETLIRTCLLEFGGNREGTAWCDPDLHRFSEIYNKQGYKYWVVESSSGQIVGGAGIGYLTEEVCELQKMYCLKEARGTGVAHQLLKLCLEYAKAYYKKCYLETLGNMHAANRFYQKNGFRKLERPYLETEHFSCDVWYIKELEGNSTFSKISSPLVFGCAIEPMMAGRDSTELLDHVYSCGINTFDTAEFYGQSEAVLGKWLKTKRREDIVILTKGCHPHETDRVTPEDLRYDILQSLKRLQTEYIDLYALHRDDLSVEVGPLMEVLDEFCKKGMIREIGMSNWTHQRMAEANAYARAKGMKQLIFSSPNYGILDVKEDPWGGSAGGVCISGEENIDARKWYKENGISVFSYSGLGRGFLTGRLKSTDTKETAATILDYFAMKGFYSKENMQRLARVEQKAAEYGCAVSDMALAWLLNQELTVYPILSSTRKENMERNMRAVNIKLSPEEVKWMSMEGNTL